MDKYYCNDCNYSTTISKHYYSHCNTIKHKKNTDIHKSLLHICEYCNKEYKRQNSLWYHSQKCKIEHDKIMDKYKLENQKNEAINDLNKIKEFNHVFIEELKQEMKQEINELKDKIDPLTEKVNTLDDKIDNVKPVVFNLNVFLNEDCKHAISFDELLEKLQYHFDLSRTLTEDTTITILKTLSTMTLYERPIHCVDLKRNKLMIKENDKWTKDMSVFNKLPKHASKTYSKHVNKWTEKNPDFLESEDKSYLYNMYANKEGEEINTPKIIRNVSKITTIPKKEITNEE
jgi:hypothetical protein